jgi:hypothetical protein
MSSHKALRDLATTPSQKTSISGLKQLAKNLFNWLLGSRVLKNAGFAVTCYATASDMLAPIRLKALKAAFKLENALPRWPGMLSITASSGLEVRGAVSRKDKGPRNLVRRLLIALEYGLEKEIFLGQAPLRSSGLLLARGGWSGCWAHQ